MSKGSHNVLCVCIVECLHKHSLEYKQLFLVQYHNTIIIHQQFEF